MRTFTICPRCARPFPQHSSNRLQRFCSRACQKNPRKLCAHCRIEPVHDGHPSRKYCSLACAYADRRFRQRPKCPVCEVPISYESKTCRRHIHSLERQSRERECVGCGKRFSPYPSTIGRSGIRFCSRRCRVDSGYRPAMLDVSCYYCGAQFKRTRAAIAREIHTFCSKTCAWNYNSGPRNRGWRGGIRGWRGMGWERARKAARQRDKVCRLCGKTPKENCQRLSVDHIVPYSTFDDPEQANDLSNLVSLCRSCHAKKTHGPEYHFLRGNTEHLDQFRVAVNA